MTGVPTSVPARRTGWIRARGSVGRELLRRPATAFAVAVIAVLMVFAVFAPLVAPYDPAAQDIPNRLQAPSSEHLLGTDQFGRDIFSRIVYGTRVSFEVAIPTVAIAFGIGLVIGVVAGYLGGRADTALTVLMDTLQAFPSIMLALVLIAVFGPSIPLLIAVIAVSFIPGYGRLSRASVLAAKQNQYVEAARALGASNIRIARTDIVPNIVAPLFILMALDLPFAIAAEAGISFLGLGVQPPKASWGVILAEGFQRVSDAPWGLISAGGAIMLATLAFTFLGETLRDLLDPKGAALRRLRK